MRVKTTPKLFLNLALAFILLPLLGVHDVLADEDKSEPVSVEKAEYVLENLQGDDVQVREDGSSQWEKAQEGQVLEAGDEIKTGDGSKATLMLQSETSVQMNSQSDMKLDKVEPTEQGGFFSRLKLMAGKILADVKKNLQESQSTFEVESNGVVCGVRGTAFEMETQGDDVETRTHEGEVEVKSGSEVNVAKAGNAFAFKKGKFFTKRRLTRAEARGFKKWRAFRKEIFKKRMARLAALKEGRMKPWMRQHPRLNRGPNGLRNLKDLKDRKDLKDKMKDRKGKGKNPLDDLGGLHLGL